MSGLEFIQFLFWAGGIVVVGIVGLTAWCLRDRTKGGRGWKNTN